MWGRPARAHWLQLGDRHRLVGYSSVRHYLAALQLWGKVPLPDMVQQDHHAEGHLCMTQDVLSCTGPLLQAHNLERGILFNIMMMYSPKDGGDELSHWVDVTHMRAKSCGRPVLLL